MARTILVTGANTGIGRALVNALAQPGDTVWLACRSRAKTEPVLREVAARGATAEFLALDLADLRQSAAAARVILDRCPRLDAVVCNAGLAGHRGRTRDGYELAFGTNHLGHFAFLLPLLPLLEASNGVVVNVSSGNHYRASGIPFDALKEPTRTVTGLPEYSVSKLANVLFTAELRRRYPSIPSISLHPGRIKSDAWRAIPQPARSAVQWLLRMKPVSVGASAVAHALEMAQREGNRAPLYLHERAARPPNPAATDAVLAQQLWDYSTRACEAAQAAQA